RERPRHARALGGLDHAAGTRGPVERAALAALRRPGIGPPQRPIDDLAGGAPGAAIQLAGHDDPQADARADVQVHELVDVADQPVPALADLGDIHVVLEDRVRAELAVDELHETLAPPSRESVRELDLFATGMHGGGTSRGGAGEL